MMRLTSMIFIRHFYQMHTFLENEAAQSLLNTIKKIFQSIELVWEKNVCTAWTVKFALPWRFASTTRSLMTILQSTFKSTEKTLLIRNIYFINWILHLQILQYKNGVVAHLQAIDFVLHSSINLSELVETCPNYSGMWIDVEMMNLVVDWNPCYFEVFQYIYEKWPMMFLCSNKYIYPVHT